MKPVSSLFSRVLPHVPSAPEPLVQQAIVDACITFCSESEIVRRRLDSFTTVEGQSRYDIDLPVGTALVRMSRVTVDGSDAVHSVAWLLSPGESVVAGKPTKFFVDNDDDELQLALWPTPDKAYTVDAVAVLKPSRSATQVFDILVEDYAEAIVYGALANLMSHPGTTFSSPEGAVLYTNRFNALCKRVRAEGHQYRVNSSLRVVSTPFV